MRNDFDEELRKRLAEYREEPGEHLWKGIEPLIRDRDSMGWLDKTTDFFTALSLVTIAFLMTPGLSIDTSEQQASLMDKLRPREDHAERTTAQPNPTPIKTTSAAAVSPAELGSDEIDPITKPDQHEGNRANADNYFFEAERTAMIGSTREDRASVPQPENEGRPDQEVVQPSTRYTLSASDATISFAAGDTPDRDEIPVPGEDKRLKEEEKQRKSEERAIIRRKNERAYKKFNIYFIAMPTFGYQRIESNQEDNIIIESIKKVSAFSTSRLGVRLELGVETPLSNRLKAYGGLLYYQRRQTIDYTEKQLDSTSVAGGQNGEINLTPTFTFVEKSFEYELKNLGVQLGLNYQLSKRKFLHTAGSGVEFQVPLNRLNETDLNQGFTSNPSAYVFFNLYYRLQYPSEGRLKAVLQPTLNYSFYIHENFNAPFYVKPYGLGLSAGVTYNF